MVEATVETAIDAIVQDTYVSVGVVERFFAVARAYTWKEEETWM